MEQNNDKTDEDEMNDIFTENTISWINQVVDDLLSCSLEEHTMTDKTNTAEPTTKIMAIVKAYPS